MPRRAWFGTYSTSAPRCVAAFRERTPILACGNTSEFLGHQKYTLEKNFISRICSFFPLQIQNSVNLGPFFSMIKIQKSQRRNSPKRTQILMPRQSLLSKRWRPNESGRRVGRSNAPKRQGRMPTISCPPGISPFWRPPVQKGLKTPTKFIEKPFLCLLFFKDSTSTRKSAKIKSYLYELPAQNLTSSTCEHPHIFFA